MQSHCSRTSTLVWMYCGICLAIKKLLIQKNIIIYRLLRQESHLQVCDQHPALSLVLLLSTQWIQFWNLGLLCPHWWLWDALAHCTWLYSCSVCNERHQKSPEYLTRLWSHKCLFDNHRSWTCRRLPFYTHSLFHVCLSWLWNCLSTHLPFCTFFTSIFADFISQGWKPMDRHKPYQETAFPIQLVWGLKASTHI